MLKATLAVAVLSLSAATLASETVTYTYDAKGRLVKVQRAGTVNNNITAEYTHDRANNRKRMKVTGSPN